MTRAIDKYIHDRPAAIRHMNELGKKGQPFFFLIDYAMQQPLVCPLAAIDPQVLRYDLRGQRNAPPAKTPESVPGYFFEKYPVSLEAYRDSFGIVQQHLQAGNSFLANLTFPTPVHTNLSLQDIFQHAQAAYRLCWAGHFAIFSPETFVQIRGGQISTRPMKGTMAASMPDAPQRLLSDLKEKAEHATIVDLLRNDLSMVATQVRVQRYRYLERLRTHRGDLWQTSSEISGTLPTGFREQLGDLIFALLPAGSISGAPKPKTLAVIREAETYERGYYTGVFGLFDGQNLDSAVAIRFIEDTPSGLIYKSGGGITAFSHAAAEHQELIDKVYLPFHPPAAAVAAAPPLWAHDATGDH